MVTRDGGGARARGLGVIPGMPIGSQLSGRWGGSTTRASPSDFVPWPGDKANLKPGARNDFELESSGQSPVTPMCYFQ